MDGLQFREDQSPHGRIKTPQRGKFRVLLDKWEGCGVGIIEKMQGGSVGVCGREGDPEMGLDEKWRLRRGSKGTKVSPTN